MATLFDRLCTGAEQCYNLATLATPWVSAAAGAIPFGSVITKAQTAYYERPLLLRELSIVRQSLKHFESTLAQIEQIQKTSNLQFCSLDLGKATIVEIKTLLEWYNVEDLVTKVSTLSDPGWYRLQLNYMTTLMNNVMANIQLETQTLLVRARYVATMPKGAAKTLATKQLQEQTCSLAA